MAMKLPRASRAWVNIGASMRRFLKRMQAKQERAEARRDPEDAPRRRTYGGWAD